MEEIKGTTGDKQRRGGKTAVYSERTETQVKQLEMNEIQCI